MVLQNRGKSYLIYDFLSNFKSKKLFISRFFWFKKNTEEIFKISKIYKNEWNQNFSF